MNIRVGDRVATPLGLGEVVGKDLPESKVWRWTVRITGPNESSRFVIDFTDSVACFFPDEITKLKEQP